jgi:hypothetical protein
MISIDAIIENLPNMNSAKRAIWAANAATIIARGASRQNPRYADALRIHDAIAAFEAVRPAETELIAACGLDWERTTAGRTTYRGFDAHRFVARITRVRPGTYAVRLHGASLPHTYGTLSAARAAAAEALHAGTEDAPAALPRAA